MSHVVDGHRERVVVAEHDHGQRVADEDHVGVRSIDPAGRREVVGRHHHQGILSVRDLARRERGRGMTLCHQWQLLRFRDAVQHPKADGGGFVEPSTNNGHEPAVFPNTSARRRMRPQSGTSVERRTRWFQSQLRHTSTTYATWRPGRRAKRANSPRSEMHRPWGGSRGPNT